MYLVVQLDQLDRIPNQVCELYEDLEPEAQNWVRSIPEQVERVYVIANNHYRGQGPANALQLMEQLTQGEVPVPEPLAQHFDFPWL